MGVLIEAAAVSASEAVGLTQEACYTDSMASTDILESFMDTSSTGSEAADNDPCELDKPEYKTDDFRLFAFKIAPCTNEDPHSWCLCPFAHPGEKAMRRDPRLYKYTGVSCPDYRKGTCKRGNACPYAHGVFEVWLHPSRYRTQTCKDAPHCTRQVCFFAHSPEELRQVDQEDLLVLDETSDTSSGCSNLTRSDSDSTLSTDTMEPASQMPRCGPNTNAKAAAVAKAKAAAAADKAAAAAASADKAEKASMKSSLLSCSSSNNSSPATANGRVASGLQSLGGLGSLSNSMLSMLSQGMLGVSGHGLGKQDWDLGSMLGSSGRLPSLPMDLAGDTAASAHSAGGLGPLCDTFGSLDLAAAAAAATAGSSLANSWSPSPVGTAAGVGDANLNTANLGGASLGLPAPQLGLAGDLSYLAGQYNSSSSSLALAAAAQQAASQQQQMQDVMTAVLLHQQQQLQQQQHRQAMWTAAFAAAANVGLDGAAAAACADAAVQSTTAATSNINAATAAGLPGSQMFPASTGGNFRLGSLHDPQLSIPSANLLQQHMGVHSMLGGSCLTGIDHLAGQLPLQASLPLAGGFLQ